MARTSDADRILGLLAASPQASSSNRRIRSELSLSDERYAKVRDELLRSGDVEKYVCRGGGIRLTSKGDVTAEADAVPDEKKTVSAVAKEEHLYPLLVRALEKDFPDDVVFNTGNLRKRGKWQNPDVTHISIEAYPRLRKRDVVVTTYEVKPWGLWDVAAVFEAASHARFAHEAWVVLEWPEGALTLPDFRIDQLVRECQRFGVGLATMHPHYSAYRLHEHIEPAPPSTPLDGDVETWLDYALERHPDASEAFEKAMDANGGSDLGSRVGK